MEPFFFKIGKDLPIMAVPDTRVQMDGHPVITNAYNIYEDITADDPTALFANDDIYLKKHSNPNYLGTIIFEIPGRVFNYVDDGSRTLTPDEIEEVVEGISHFRDNPYMWKNFHNN